MKKILAFGAVFLTLSILSCQDSKDEVRTPSDDVDHYKTVGMKIPTETGARWIETYNIHHPSSGRIEGLFYSVDGATLESALSSVDDLVGVAFHYGIDETGLRHIILIPVGGNLKLWTSNNSRLYVDTNTGEVVSKATAMTWAQNYKDENPESIWFHYFGRNVFDDIITISGFTNLDIMPALDDLDLSPELLLVVGNPLSLLLGRTATETSVYDASYPCPRCPVD